MLHSYGVHSFFSVCLFIHPVISAVDKIGAVDKTYA